MLGTNNRGKCDYWQPSVTGCFRCSLIWRAPSQKVKICCDCPIWNPLDITFEEVYGECIQQTYDWWRDAWIRTGQTYAKDRMVDFVTTQIDPPLRVSKPNLEAKKPVLSLAPLPASILAMLCVALVIVLVQVLGFS